MEKSLIFDRTAKLLGEQALTILGQAYVAIVGLGGVGGFCAEALVRSGIGGFVLADIDAVRETNFNRQLLATCDSLGQPKTEVAARRLLAINPDVKIQCRTHFFHQDSASAILTPRPDVVVDAIDSVNPKVALLEYCLQHDIRVVSSLGMARRLDPTRLRVGTLDTASGDRLLRQVRHKLRHRVTPANLRQISVVYSEEPARQAVFAAEPPDSSYYQQGRLRQPMGSVCHVIGTAGMWCAYLVIQQILCKGGIESV